MMTERIIIAGAGGQGIMVLGRLIAEAAMREDKFVTWLPAYGAEVRGGTAYCMVIISDQEISSPFIERADTLIIMNQPSWGKFKNRISKNGVCIVNSSLARAEKKAGSKILEQPFTEIAAGLGNIKVANTLAAGYYIAYKKVVQPKTVIGAIKGLVPKDKTRLIQINHLALLKGIELGRSN